MKKSSLILSFVFTFLVSSLLVSGALAKKSNAKKDLIIPIGSKEFRQYRGNQKEIRHQYKDKIKAKKDLFQANQKRDKDVFKSQQQKRMKQFWTD